MAFTRSPALVRARELAHQYARQLGDVRRLQHRVVMTWNDDVRGSSTEKARPARGRDRCVLLVERKVGPLFCREERRGDRNGPRHPVLERRQVGDAARDHAIDEVLTLPEGPVLLYRVAHHLA